MLKATTTEPINCDEATGNRSAPQLLPTARLSILRNAGVLSSGVMALLYLLTEGLLVEAPEKLIPPVIISMFFISFLALLTLGGVIG
ncbi:MAG: hypothetical protein C0473_03415 [Cyanobacteria bacterium DS3.002]|jgi:hypothetical protein|nr:hypothetical protein [Cyanobacteria bacterium DS3.002]